MNDLPSDRLRRALDLFAGVIDLEEGRREARLAEIEETDPEIVDEVRRLLAEDAEAERSEVPLAAGPDRVGRFRIERRLGAGGAGVVYRARPIEGEPRFPVAVKILDLADPQFVARFEEERRILGGLEHPFIARMLDSGTTESGAPWIAMELVEGEPITTYADSRRLTLRARVELFDDVLEGVGFAHEQLVIHRDIKPANVLVTARGEPKLLDFGIAAELGSSVSEGEASFTPNYASPEQLGGDRPTPADDVYSLGVLLCELLCGVRPPRAEGLSGSALASWLRASSPPRASALVSSNPNRVQVAGARGVTPRALERALAGDLDAILGAALAPDRARRYRSVAALAADLRHWRDRRPVGVRPRGPIGIAALAIRRHRLASATALVVLVGAGVESCQLAALARSRELAEVERIRTEAVLRELMEALSGVDPWRGVGSDEESATDFLKRAAARAESLDAPSGLRSRVLGRIGQLELARGGTELAIATFERARAAAPTESDRLDAESKLVDALIAAGRIEEGLRLARSVARRRAARGDPPESRLAAEVRLAEALLRDSREEVERLRAAESAARGAVALAEEVAVQARKLPVGEENLPARAVLTLASILWRQGEHDESGALARRGEALQVAAGRRGALFQEALNLQALVALSQGRFTEAVTRFERVAQEVESRTGERHPSHVEALNNLGTARARELAGDVIGAKADLRRAVALAESLYAENHPVLLTLRANLAHVLAWNDEAEEAETIYRGVRAAFGASLSPDHPFLPLLDAFVAETHSLRGDHARALAALGTASEADDFIPTATRGVAAGVRAAAATQPSDLDLAILERSASRLKELQGEHSQLAVDAARRLERERARRSAASTPSSPP
jgi:serine/threonine-protein kinase